MATNHHQTFVYAGLAGEGDYIGDGGLYRLEGAWVGALVYALLDNYSREWTPEIGNVLGPERFNTIIGIVFLVIVLLSPGGLVGLWERFSDRIRRRRTPTVGPGAEGPPQQALSSDVP